MEIEDTTIKLSSEETERSTETCENCETIFEGNFCPHCGQSIKTFKKPLKFFILDFAGNLFAFDTRFWQTFTSVLFSPGKMVKEYVGGKRVRYMPPFRFYVFVSFFFFLLLSITTNRSIEKNKDNIHITSESIDKALNSSDSLEVNSGNAEFLDVNEKKPQTTISVMGSESDPHKLSKRLKDIQAKPDVYIARFFKYLSWSVFFLMPLLGLFLWLFFQKSEPFYVSHFIFAINQHIVFFILLIIIMLLNFMLPDKKSTPENYLMMLLPVYTYIGAWQLYRRRWFSVLLRMFAATFLYISVSMIITGFIAIFAFIL
ncbi:MAG: DUF3667 domain-containing protein [Bacteroidales bacterium]|nr:DUF3667 domain-containing protein [Bacteroidales bacterium]